MREVDRLARNAQRLTELHPWFRTRISRVIADMERMGRRPRIQESWRSLDQQAIELAEGNSNVEYGYHNVTSPAGIPESFAADVLDDDDPLDGDPREPGSVYFLMLAGVAERHGLATLIRWGLKPGDRAKVDEAILAGNFAARIRIGKDPTHVQPGSRSGITIERLRSGWRPDPTASGTVTVSDTRSSPESDMRRDLEAARLLGQFPWPNWQDASIYPDWLRLSEDLAGAQTSGLSRLPPESLGRVMDFPFVLTRCVLRRVMSFAASRGIVSQTEAFGLWERTFHEHPMEMAEYRAQLNAFMRIRQ